MKDLMYFSKPENVYCYHYERLGEKEKRLYRKLVDGMFRFQSSIIFWGTESDTIDEIYEKIKMDLPAAFFDEGSEVVWYPVLHQVKVRPRYRFSRQDAENILTEVLRRTEPLIESCRSQTNLEKEKRIHDWFCANVIYDDNYMQKMGGSSFELAAPLLWGKGVCSGISKAAKFLFDQVGIRSILMTGRTKDRLGTAGEEHCWLMVKIDDQRYHLDITFDITAKTQRYFNLTDREILRDRILT